MNAIASLGIPLIWGVALSSLLHGVPVSSAQEYTGTFWDLFSLYTVLAGVALVALSALHGAAYLALRTNGDLRARAERAAALLAVPAALIGAVFLAWTLVVGKGQQRPGPLPGHRRGRPGRGCRRRRRRVRPRTAERSCLRRDRRDDRARRRHAVHRAVSARDGLVDRLRRQPHHDELVVRPLHARRDQRLHARPAAGDPALPELGLPRLPGATRPGEAGGEPGRAPGSERREEPTS